MKRDLGSKRTAVYQVLDAGKKVIYVGVSVAPLNRFQAHLRGGRLPEGCSCKVLEWRETRREALDRESSLIRELEPSLNKMCRSGFSCRNRAWDRALALEMIEAGHEVVDIAHACDVDRNTITYNFYSELRAKGFNRKE